MPRRSVPRRSHMGHRRPRCNHDIGCGRALAIAGLHWQITTLSMTGHAPKAKKILVHETRRRALVLGRAAEPPHLPLIPPRLAGLMAWSPIEDKHIQGLKYMDLADDVGAFVPGDRFEHLPLASGRLSGLTFAIKDLYDIAGAVTGFGNPDWARTHPPASATDRKSTRLNSSHLRLSRMPSSA